jgi:hypothetical protein
MFKFNFENPEHISNLLADLLGMKFWWLQFANKKVIRVLPLTYLLRLLYAENSLPMGPIIPLIFNCTDEVCDHKLHSCPCKNKLLYAR